MEDLLGGFWDTNCNGGTSLKNVEIQVARESCMYSVSTAYTYSKMRQIWTIPFYEYLYDNGTGWEGNKKGKKNSVISLKISIYKRW